LATLEYVVSDMASESVAWLKKKTSS